MQEITSLGQFRTFASSSLLIIDFYATWCGPCKAISPIFEKLATQNASNAAIIFAKCDVDKAQDVSRECGITAMPTFQFWKEGKKVDEVKGADGRQLTTKIGYYVGAVGNGSAKAGRNANESKPVPAGPGSLRHVIDVEKCAAMSAQGSIGDIVKSATGTTSSVIQSTSSAALILNIFFKQPVNLTALKMSAPKDSLQSAPSKVSLTPNHPETLESIEDFEKSYAAQTISLYSDDYSQGTAEFKLKPSKFKDTKSLTILVDSNLAGASVTKIAALDFVGVKS